MPARFVVVLSLVSLAGCAGAAVPRPTPPARRVSQRSPALAPLEVAPPPQRTAPPDGADEPEPRPRFRAPTVPRNRTTVRVLLYHTIGWVKPRRGVQPRQLREQLDWMEDNDVEVIRMTDLVDFLEGESRLPERAAVITIDDGERNVYTHAFPVFVERGTPFALGLITEAIERWDSTGALRWHQIREMVDSGLCEIASHSHTHRWIPALPSRTARYELEHSRRLIEENVGVTPEVFFYPLGAHDARTRALTREAGYRAGFAVSGAPVRATTPRFRIPRYEVDSHTGLWTFEGFFSHG